MSVGVYLLVYVLALLVGVAANMLLDVQLRRPGLGKAVAMLGLLLFIGAAFALTGLPHPEWLLLFWAGIGLLTGLGSSEPGARL